MIVFGRESQERETESVLVARSCCRGGVDGRENLWNWRRTRSTGGNCSRNSGHSISTLFDEASSHSGGTGDRPDYDCGPNTALDLGYVCFQPRNISAGRPKRNPRRGCPPLGPHFGMERSGCNQTNRRDAFHLHGRLRKPEGNFGGGIRTGGLRRSGRGSCEAVCPGDVIARTARGPDFACHSGRASLNPDCRINPWDTNAARLAIARRARCSRIPSRPSMVRWFGEKISYGFIPTLKLEQRRAQPGWIVFRLSAAGSCPQE